MQNNGFRHFCKLLSGYVLTNWPPPVIFLAHFTCLMYSTIFTSAFRIARVSDDGCTRERWFTVTSSLPEYSVSKMVRNRKIFVFFVYCCAFSNCSNSSDDNDCFCICNEFNNRLCMLVKRNPSARRKRYTQPVPWWSRILGTFCVPWENLSFEWQLIHIQDTRYVTDWPWRRLVVASKAY